MPLSEEELRLLEQMERALVAEDPKLASTMRGTKLRATARRRAIIATVVFVVGVVVLMTGAVSRIIPIGIVGFVVMLASAYVALTSWRSQDAPREGAAPEAPPAAGGAPQFRVVEGGRRRPRPSRRTKRVKRSPRPRGSMMERLEERWRRRRDQNGY